MFRIADDLTLPSNAVTQTFALLGRRGSGKTYAAGKLAETLLDGGAQLVVVDPVGTWFGLRLDVHGNAAGIPIPVFGGQRGDIPLEATAGAVVAQLVAERGTSVVLDVSEFTGGDQRRFVADFATELLHLKKRNRSPLMLVFDEAQEFVPQYVRPDHARMVGAMEKLVKLGRNFGIGVTLISQRPQAVHKDVLNQTEVLMVFQLTGPQERKVIEGWVNDHGFGKKEIDDLPRLAPGTAFVWSPQWLGRFSRVQIGRKRTFDASSTPESGTVEARAILAPIDLGKVREAMAATIEEAKANDPKALREEVSRLRAELATAPGRADMVARVSEDAVALAAERDRYRIELAAFEGATPAEVRRLRHMETRFDQVIAAVDGYRADGEGRYARADYSQREPNAVPRKSAPRAPRDLPINPDGHKSFRVTLPSVAVEVGGLTKCPREILSALAVRHPTPLTKVQLATLAGYAPGGGGFNNAIGELKGKGMIERDGDSFAITAAGLKVAPRGQAPRTAAELVDFWCSKLTGRGRDMLRLLSRSRRPLTKEEIAREVGMEVSAGGFNNYLGHLRSNGLIQKTRGGFEAASSLAVR